MDDRQFMYNKSSDRDDVSITSSLAEFERFERELAQSSSTSSVEKIPSSDSKSSVSELLPLILQPAVTLVQFSQTH
jgi:hypothetical protein